MSTDKNGSSRTPYLYIFQAAKNYPADFSAIFVVFILPEVNMIGSRVTIDAPREQKQLGAFGKMYGLSSRLFLSFPAPFPATNFCHLCPRALARLRLS